MVDTEVYLVVNGENEKSYKMFEVEYGENRLTKHRKFKILKSDVKETLYMGKTYRMVGHVKKGLAGSLLIPSSIVDVSPKSTMISEEEQYMIDMARMRNSNVW